MLRVEGLWSRVEGLTCTRDADMLLLVLVRFHLFGLRVQVLEFRVSGSRVPGFGFRFWGSGVPGFGFRCRYLGFRIEVLGFRF